MNKYNKLEVQSIGAIGTIVRPAIGESPSLDSPATAVFADFRNVRPLVIEIQTSVDEAISLMDKAHVNLKQVIDRDEHFLGLVSRRMLGGPDVLKISQARGANLHELTVGDVMIPCDSLRALSIQQVERCRIGDIVETMRDIGEEFIVVVDTDIDNICGVITANQIAHALHVAINIQHRAATFSEINEALHH